MPTGNDSAASPNRRLPGGSIVAIVTPMQADGAVDYGALDALVDWHLASGTHGLVPVGTTGESATLTVPEHLPKFG